MENVLPQSIVKEHHRLERAAAVATQELYRLCWHWTMDASNAKRVSYREYGQKVGWSQTWVGNVVNGYDRFRQPTNTLTVTQCVEAAKLRGEKRVIAEAVAKARGTTVDTAVEHHRDQVELVHDIAVKESRRKEVPLEDIAPEVARFVVNQERGKADARAIEKKHVELQYLNVEVLLEKSRRHLLDAYNHALDVKWTDEHQRELLAEIRKTRRALDLVEIAVTEYQTAKAKSFKLQEGAKLSEEDFTKLLGGE